MFNMGISIFNIGIGDSHEDEDLSGGVCYGLNAIKSSSIVGAAYIYKAFCPVTLHLIIYIISKTAVLYQNSTPPI